MPSPDILPPFFAAADRVFAHQPWEAAHDSHVLAVDGHELGWPEGACLCIIGASGDHPGLMIFPSLEEYLAFIEQAEKASRIDEPPRLDGAVFSINFDSRHDAPREMVKRAKALRLRPLDAQGFPWLQHHGPGGVEIALDDEDYAFATAVLDGLAALLDAHPDLFERVDLTEPLGATGAAGPEDDRRAVAVTAPHPKMPWPWGDSAIEYYRWWEADEIREAFLAARAAAGASATEQEALGEVVTQLFAFKIEEQNVEPLDFSHEDMEELLLEHFPRNETVEEAELSAVPDRVGQLLRFLAETGRLDRELAEGLCEDAERCRDELLRRMRDPARFGPEKTIVLAMKAQGVDIEDEAAVARFMEDFAARAELESGAPRPPSAKKWVWAPGDSVPDPKGECPCGSGRRYKKCCMPR
jgi:hypothetical protein